MLVNRRANRARTAQRSEFREASHQASRSGTKMTKEAYLRQGSRFSVMEDLEDEEHLTPKDALVIYSAKEADNQAIADLAKHSSRQNEIKKDRSGSAKVMAQEKRKDLEKKQGQRNEVSAKVKPIYRPKMSIPGSSPNGPNSSNGAIKPNIIIDGQVMGEVANTMGPVQIARDVGFSSGPSSLNEGMKSNSAKLVGPKKILNGDVLDQKATENPSNLSVNKEAMGKKNIKGHRIHNVVHGSTISAGQEESKILENPIELNGTMTCMEHSSDSNVEQPPDQWDPNEDVAPDFMEANELVVAEAHLVQRQEGGVDRPR
ncbi:hypothetical protein K1719_025505 [Acacia pycnantha]|nr:hypothetical protein K1719_025505 [Acacia pycnantha]